MNIRTSLQFFLGLVMMVAIVAHGEAALTNDPVLLRKDIEKRGARAVVQELWSNTPAWTSAMQSIGEGKHAWIDVAVLLRVGSDGGASSDLHDSMFVALGKAPQYVLNVALHAFPLESLCTGRTEPAPTYREAIADLDSVKKALTGVKEVPLQSKRKACLNKIRLAEKQLSQYFDQ